MRAPEQHIFSHTLDSLGDWFEAKSLPRFRAKQVLEWVYRKNVVEPGAMTNLGKRERTLLTDGMVFDSGETLAHQVASDGTQKLLVEWWDGDAPGAPALPVLGQRAGDPTRQTECVMIPAESRSSGAVRKTACVSSQVGCPVGCRFCASGMGGLDGNLTAGRIVEQVHRLARLPRVERISNVVFMGMGEPLSNFGAVNDAVRTMTADWGLGISARRITISTVGLPKAIEKLADRFDVPVTLALSLHATDDALRRELIPWAEYSTIEQLLAACQTWFEKTGREITLEYTLLREVNDRPAHAERLAELARTMRGNVNLIRYNEVEGVPYRRPLGEDVREFQRILRERGVNAHIRASRGRDISAACGQLRHERAESPGDPVNI
ncbi:MAG: 23S rRNA (adenine(2503)-C(2))-methyltransferase RlmN [Planctomycetota bacterium]